MRIIMRECISGIEVEGFYTETKRRTEQHLSLITKKIMNLTKDLRALWKHIDDPEQQQKKKRGKKITASNEKTIKRKSSTKQLNEISLPESISTENNKSLVDVKTVREKLGNFSISLLPKQSVLKMLNLDITVHP